MRPVLWPRLRGNKVLCADISCGEWFAWRRVVHRITGEFWYADLVMRPGWHLRRRPFEELWVLSRHAEDRIRQGRPQASRRPTVGWWFEEGPDKGKTGQFVERLPAALLCRCGRIYALVAQHLNVEPSEPLLKVSPPGRRRSQKSQEPS